MSSLGYYSVYYRLDPQWYDDHGDQEPAALGLLSKYAAQAYDHSEPYGPHDVLTMRERAVASASSRWPAVPERAWVTGEIDHRDDYRGFVLTSIPIRIDADWLRENGDQPYYADGDPLSAYLEQQVDNPSPSDAENKSDANVEWAREQTLDDLSEQWPTVPRSAWIIDGSDVTFDTDEYDIVKDEDGDGSEDIDRPVRRGP